MRFPILVIVFLSSASYSLTIEEQIEKLEFYKYKFPLMICASAEYRACFGGISVDECTIQMKSNRSSCNTPITNPEYEMANKNYSEYAQCMFLGHIGVDTLDEAANHCAATVNIDMDESSQFIHESDEEWVNDLLK